MRILTALLLIVLSSSLAFGHGIPGLHVADWYPQGNDYVFECEVTGFIPTSYTWDFGDGNQLVDVTNYEVFHSYADDSEYTVTCTPTNGIVYLTYELTVGTSTPTHTCVENVADATATCHNGEITKDEMNGCRNIVCVGDFGSTEVLACDKPNEGEKEYFEMYKVAGSGAHLCLGETCIMDNGYAKSAEYPICSSHDGGHGHDAIHVPKDVPAPSIDLIVTEDAKKGWNLYFDVENFEFAPHNVNSEHVWTEGHAHLYINGEKITRLYGPWFYVKELPEGENTLRVTLNANTHAEFMVDGSIVDDSEIVIV